MAAATTLRTPLGRRVKVVEHGTGTPAVFLHSGVGSAGEWKQVFSLWPEGYRLVAIEAYRDGTGPGEAGRRSLDDYADQVYAVAEHVGVSVCLVEFSWGGGMRRSSSSSTSITDPARSLGGRLRAGRRFSLSSRPGETYGTFSSTACSVDTLASVTAPVHVVEGSQTSAVDHAICDVVPRHVPHAQHTLIDGAGHMMPLTHPEPLTRALLTGIER